MCKAVKAFFEIGILIFGLGFVSVTQGVGLAQEAEEDTISTNFELLRLVVEEAIDEACGRLPLLKPEILCLVHDSDAAGNWLVEQAFIGSLRHRNHRVWLPDTSHVQSQPSCTDRLTLHYRLAELDFLYPDSRRKHLFGPQLVQRSARLHLFLRLDKEDGEVLWTDEAQRTGGDWIPTRMLEAAERKALPCASPRLRSDDWGRFAEPALLSAVVGGLIYLFYSTQ